MRNQQRSRSAILRLCGHFNRRVPDHTVDYWCNKIDHIPMEALAFACQQIEDEHDSMPMNLPKAIKKYWMLWQNMHPEKMARTVTPCEACESSGVLFYSQEHDGTEYLWATRCAHCRNWQGVCGEMWALLTVQQIEARSGQIVRRYPAEMDTVTSTTKHRREMPPPDIVRNDTAALAAGLGGA